ncbi:efflux pump antibiotic resistance protein [Aspergillus arachidicola]|uniref:Efflux pump antibiotic resistance protein n=1 Tax=Aspergillus arachidicola TaxID=656916 RepID=A0A2G7G5B8_9EURO|nr:efflux pump antibiotic resistance protein [Aspergillus arachidicola]
MVVPEDDTRTPTLMLEEQDAPCEEENMEYPTGFQFLVVLLAMCMSLILTGLDFNMIATALPTITTHFGSIEDVGWYYSAYRLTSCSFQFMFGKLYHLFTVKSVFLASVVIFEIGSLIAGVAPTTATLVLGRSISGMGCAGIISGVFTMVVQSFPLRRRPFFTGIAAGVEGASATVAPLLGGALTDSISWRWCFYINLPIGGLSFLLILLFFQDPQKTPGIFVPSITSMLLALQWGGSKYGWGNARIIVLFILTAVLLGAFMWQERRRGDNALLPGRIMRRRSLLAGMWFSFCNNSTLSVFEYYMPIYFQVVRGASATVSGVLSLPIAIGVPVAVMCGSSATSLLGYYTPFMIITGILTPIAAGLLTTVSVEQSLTSLLCYQALLGVGAGVGFQGPQNFGPALFVSIAQTIFTGQLLTRLESLLPNLDTYSLSAMGMSDLEKYVPSADIPRVIEGYDKALATAFFLPVGLACASMIGALGMEWRSVKRKDA